MFDMISQLMHPDTVSNVGRVSQKSVKVTTDNKLSIADKTSNSFSISS